MRDLWLLDLEIGGRLWRFAEAPALVSSAGEEYSYDGGLSVGDVPASATEAAVRVDAGVDWAALAARGLDLEAGAATLRRWVVGQPLERARVYLAGRISEPEWGAPAEGLELTIQAAAPPTLIPDGAARVCDETWPVDPLYEIPETPRDAAYPLVIGYPGRAGLVAVDSPIRPGVILQGSPAYLVEYNSGAAYAEASKLLIAGHEVHATHVRIFDATAGTSEVRDVQHTTDLLGRRIAFVDFVGAGGVPVADDEYWAAWVPILAPETEGGGGVWNLDRTAPLRGAGEVLEFLYGPALSRIAVVSPQARLDAGRQRAQSVHLNRFQLDFCISEQVEIGEWARAHLEEILPIRWVQGRSGGYWCAWRRDATAADARMRLSADAGQVRRLSRLRLADGPRYSRFRLEYGRLGDGRYSRRRILTGEADPADPRARPSWRCAIAQAREARRTGGTGVVELLIQSDVVQEDQTADLILDALAARYATPAVPVTYQGGPDLAALEVGDVVTVTDAEVGLDARAALVADVTVGELVTLELELLQGPGQNRRRTT